MSKLKCVCGHVIVDQTDHLPYKADLIPDKSYDKFMDSVESDLSGLLKVKNDMEKQEWIKNTFFVPPYPTDLKDSEMISDVLSKHYMTHFKTIYQCEDCGRIFIQKCKTDQFISFKPENDEWRGILDCDETDSLI
jgi:hypothetical protein